MIPYPYKPIPILAALVVAACSFTATVPESEAGTVRMSRVRLSTGVELQVAQSGPADGEPVLFLHGFTDSWFSYSRVLDGLPAHVRAIVPSQRGHGDSERPGCCYRVADFAGDAVALLDALAVPRATIVGHSMGSFIAQRIAIEHPARVERLVLIGSGATVRTPQVREFNDTVQRLADPIAPAFVREFQESTIARPVPSAFLDGVVRESQKLPARVWRETLAGLLAADAPQNLPRIQASTLIIWGDKDELLPQAEQDALVRAIRGARLVTYAGTGHSPQWEEPERVIADLRSFLGAPAAAAPSTAAATRHGEGAHRHHDAAPRTQDHAHAAQDATHATHGTHGTTTSGDSGGIALLSGLGDWHLRITTASADAQRYFDQGLRLTYAFNHDDALRSFERAVQLDPACAMCHWGIAYAIGPNINLPMDAKVEPRAHAAIGTAVRLRERVTPLERGLIDAMARRFGVPAGAARAERDAAYADAMRTVAKQFPNDIDAQTLFADAMLNLRPWNQWTKDGQPQPGTEEVVAALEAALQRQPNHAGACHFYIHTVEASPTPERALPCAERLPRLMPSAGHLVHMPAHVFLRVGRYEDAARANIAAVEADNRYFSAHAVRPGMYPMFYAPHNLHFLWAAYLLSGQHEKALEASRALVERVAIEDARTTPALEGFLQAKVLTYARFGDWDAVLAEPKPPAELKYVTGIWHYARGVASAARGDAATARAEWQAVRTAAANINDDVIIMLNPAPSLLKLAAEVLAGQIAIAEKRVAAAETHFRTAMQMEDALTYDEPPPWYHSVRHMLGEALLNAGRAADAETAFREDLRRLRQNSWSLAGLDRALRAQGKSRDSQ